jgi:hypothetical protein
MRNTSHLTTRIVSATAFSVLLFAACSKSNTADTSAGAATEATTETAGADTQVPPTAATTVGAIETTAASMQLQSDGQTAATATSEPTDMPPRELLTQAAIAFPIKAGQTNNWREAITELIGPRYAEYQASRTRYGLDRQTTVLQSTPMGDFAVIYMEGPDLDKTTQTMAKSPDTWDIAWRELTTGLHGADFNDPNALRIDEHLVLNTGDLTPDESVGLQPMNFMIPIKPEGAKDLKGRLDQIMTQKATEYRAARRGIGVAEEKVFLQNTAIGPALIVHWLAKDPKVSLSALADSKDPFDTWFFGEFSAQHLVDTAFLKSMLANNTLIADYPHAENK